MTVTHEILRGIRVLDGGMASELEYLRDPNTPRASGQNRSD